MQFHHTEGHFLWFDTNMTKGKKRNYYDDDDSFILASHSAQVALWARA
jgi:hypothetical protein